MKGIMANTKTAKGLTYLNLISLAAEIAFMFILIPVLNVFFEVVASRIIFILSIIFVIFNGLFYCLPQNLKLFYFKKRLLVVYLPTVVVIGFAIWNLISVIINIKIFGVAEILFSVMSCISPVTFSMLITKLVSDSPAPLLG